MSPAAKKRTKRKKSSAGWLAWWPLIAGILITPVTLRAAGVLALSGPGALRMLYPFALLAGEHALLLPAAVGEGASQALMYLQFPLYGLLMMAVARWKGWIAALVTVAVLHLAAVGALWALAQSGT